MWTARARAGLWACLAAVATGQLAAAPRVEPPADLVFVNGAVYTVDAAGTRATALAVSGQRIAYVGDDAGARRLAGPASRVIDLQGRMLLPGFQDSHVHPGMAPNPATALGLHGVLQREQVFGRIRAFASSNPGRPWIVGDGWDEAAFLPSGKPTRAMLDALVPDRPAYLTNNSGHAAWVNTRALESAGITDQTPDPQNGRIERDADGRATGMLQEESAMTLVARHIPAPTAAEVERDLRAALDSMTRFGVTALEDAMATPAIVAAFSALERDGELKQRTRLCLPHYPERDDDEQLREFEAVRAQLRGTRLRADCVKLFLDGAYSSHTLVLLEPYADEPARYGKGELFIERGRLERLVTRLDAAGFQVHAHAQGDGAVRAALDAFATARRHNGAGDSRHTIAHLCLIDPADLPRFRELGVVANMSPLWARRDAWEAVFAPLMFGPERSARLFPTRSLLAAGAPLAWGTDWPVTGVSPLDGLEAATTRRFPGGRDPEGVEDRPLNPDEGISLAQAIAAYTAAGAYLLHDERERGSLEPGKLADLVVLGGNLFDAPPLGIHAVPVDMTVFGGSVAYQRGNESARP